MEEDYSGRIKKLRNLALFKEKTDAEIIEWIKLRDARQKTEPKEKPAKKTAPTTLEDVVPNLSADELDKIHEKLFQETLNKLQQEYSIDMNNSNDAEMLKSLVRHIIQGEIVDKQIVRLQREDSVDTRTLKALGDYQRSVEMTKVDIQEKLGISRRQRKEKQVDSIPQFVDIVRKNARTIWERATIPIRCGNCDIELARYWLNFPKEDNKVNLELVCWKCRETIIYAK